MMLGLPHIQHLLQQNSGQAALCCANELAILERLAVLLVQLASQMLARLLGTRSERRCKISAHASGVDEDDQISAPAFSHFLR
jgi:hypothetical protein